MNIGPFSYIHNDIMLSTIDRVPIASIPKDHYQFYAIVYFFVSFFFLIYNCVTSKREIYISIEPNSSHPLKVMLASFIFIFPMFIFGGDLFRKSLVAFCCFYFLCFMSKPKKDRINKITMIGLCLSVVVILSQITWRFVLIQYMLPIIYIYVFLFTSKSNVINFFSKVKIIVLLILFGFLAIISEMHKLGLELTEVNIVSLFSNYELLIHWINRQVYRIVGIWTVLGGNIIDYTDIHGFFWGITYIKILSPIFGFDYVSLPEISATLVGANYAQPGLVAEGYANFGLFGAIINLLLAMILSECMWCLFIRKQNGLRLLLSILPFTSIIVDGGSINSVIYNSVFVLITMSFTIFIWRAKNVV
ncbi:TPA: hypothetical protein RQK13_002756 [Vibrio vulnificus]|nr:hypothetical protein [Vibrio vulnificus]